MKFFIDTAIIEEIREVHAWGVLAGVTTNPSLVVKSGRPFHDVVREIADLVKGPVSAEVTTLTASEMVTQGRELANLSEHVVVKLPLNEEGLKACRVLTNDGIKTNVTLCFSVPQALLAARAGATYISPFVGRVDDIAWDGISLIQSVKDAYVAGDIETQVLAASIRHALHVEQAALAGADVATIPYKVFKQSLKHPLTDAGLQQFMDDWAKGEAALSASQGTQKT